VNDEVTPIRPVRVLLTGASGFIGQALFRRLCSDGHLVTALSRDSLTNLGELCAHQVRVNEQTRSLLADKDCVVHLAARVHVMHEITTDPLAEFRRVNVQGTLNLARQAAAAGVRRFIFISSIKVNGESTQTGVPFTADDTPAPLDAYGVSKTEAEQGLRELAVQTGMEVVIIRPPLVYGPGVKANFATMMRWLKRGVPLPLGAIHNQRSLVALDNLVDLILRCLTHPAAAHQTFLVSDGEDVSTTELLRRMGQAMGHPARLIPVPSGMLKLAGALVGKSDVVQRLCGSLQVDIAKTRDILGWTPPVSLDEGLRRAAALSSQR
jgi:nucleoside-diphosphate-sugar epimerase